MRLAARPPGSRPGTAAAFTAMRNLPILLAIGVAALACPALAAATEPLPQAPDAGVWTPNGTVSAVATSGGKTYLGGNFSYVGPATGAAIDIDDAGGAMPLGPVSGTVLAAVADKAGGAYLGGDFMLDDGSRVQLVHVLADGSLDPGFTAPQFSGSGKTVQALTLSASTLYVGGDFSKADAETRTALAALDATDGHLLPALVELKSDWNADQPKVEALALWSGYLYAGGKFKQADGKACANLVEVKPGGGLVSSICDSSPNGAVHALAVEGNALYVGGEFSSLGVSAGAYLRRIFIFGDTPDGNWIPKPSGQVRALDTSPTAVYASGFFTVMGSDPRRGVAAVSTADASLLPWNPNPAGTLEGDDHYPYVGALLVADGGVYVGGRFLSIGGQDRNDLAKLDPVSAAATGWNPNVGGGVKTLAATTDDSIVAGGDFSSTGGKIRRHLAALGPDGTATHWNPSADQDVTELAVSPDGSTVYAGGWFAQVSGDPHKYLAAIDAGTGLATSFKPEPNGGVNSLALSADGATLYVAGNFTTIGPGAVDRPYVAAFSTSSGDPTDWRPGPDYWVSGISLSPGGDLLYAAGGFTKIGSQANQPARPGVAAIRLDTAAATEWTVPASGGQVQSLFATPAGVILGGTFTAIQGAERKGVAAADTGGTLLPWSPGFGNYSTAQSVVQSTPDRLIVGGQLTTGSRSRSVAETDAATGAVTPWDPSVLGIVNAMAVDGRRIWLAGTIQAGGGRLGLAAFTRPAEPTGGGGAGGGGNPTPPPDGGDGAGGGGETVPPAGGNPSPPPAADTTAPALSDVSLSRTRFRVARRSTALSASAGTTLRFSLSEAARVRISVQRRRAGRFVRVGVLRRSAPAGHSGVAFTGRLGRRALRPGRHRLRITAVDAAGNASRPAVAGFAIVR